MVSTFGRGVASFGERHAFDLPAVEGFASKRMHLAEFFVSLTSVFIVSKGTSPAFTHIFTNILRIQQHLLCFGMNY
jgi:hypothetical protein